LPPDIPRPALDRMQADWQSLSEYRDPAAPGWTREAFSEADTHSRHAVAAMMSAVGLEVTIDAVGNVIGDLPGSDPNAGLLVTGSHTDTVVGGGRFDGVLGVLGAIECVRLLRESRTRLRHRLRVVDFSNEEPNRHGLSCVGSRAIAGNLTPQMLALPDPDGRELSDRLRGAGWDPSGVAGCAWDASEVDAYVELHIEQGPVLESANASIGIVAGIAGINRFVVELFGRRDHAGTMPMGRRRDAVCSAAACILAVERIAAAGAGTVGTVGDILATPEAVNVVSDYASFCGEFRSSAPSWLADVTGQLEQAVRLESAARGTRSAVTWRPPEPPVAMDDSVSQVLADAASVIGHDAVRLYSGAGHDTVQIARLAPAGMVFVPSVGGRSHCPEEETSLVDCGRGIETLLQGLVMLDAS